MGSRPWVWIFPTASCGGLCLLLLGIWYAAASQSNGAAYVLFFLVLSLTLVSIPHTYVNASGFKIVALPVTPVFVSEATSLTFDVTIDPPRHLKAQMQARLRPGQPGGKPVAVVWPPEEITARVTLTTPAKARGEHSVPDFLLETTYPLGFFRGTRKYIIPQRYLVYPLPAGRPDLPSLPVLATAHQAEGSKTTGDDFAGLRAYIPGESQRHIDWKAVARGQPLVVKQFAGQHGRDIVLDWESLDSIGYEARLSQLTLWVQRAEREQHAYALNLPGGRIGHGTGEAHYRRCLRALALFPPERTR